MRGLFLVLKSLFRFLARTKIYIPPVWAGLFIAWNLISLSIKEGIMYALEDTAVKVLSAEITINEIVTKAIETPELYGFLDFMEILTAFITIYVLIKFFAWLSTRLLGANKENFGKFIIGIIMVFLIEITVSSLHFSEPFAFIPIVDGILYLFTNLNPVIYGVDWLWLKDLGLSA